MTIVPASKRVHYPLLGSASAASDGSTDRGLEGLTSFFSRSGASGAGSRDRIQAAWWWLVLVNCRRPKTLHREPGLTRPGLPTIERYSGGGGGV